MHDDSPIDIDHDRRGGEGGFAIVVVLLLVVLLTLLGASFLLMADTENRIAENERVTAQALYAAETGTLMVKRWFDRPGSAVNLANPPLALVDRTLRLIETDGDPGTAPVAADGSLALPYYKQGVDLNLDGDDDLFRKPYRGSLADTLLGTEAGPDMRIDRNASAQAAAFLDGLSTDLLPGYPGRGLQARIVLIDVYAPPYVESGGAWKRFGTATVKVVAQVYNDLDGSDRVLAERMVRVVLNEIPYQNGGDLGPLHSCQDLTWNGEFTVHWGVTTAVAGADLHNNHDKLAVSLPREFSADLRVDLLWGHDSDTNFAGYKTAIDGLRIDDPWLRATFGGPLAEAPNATDVQPWPFTWNVGDPLDDGDIPYHPGPPGPHPYPMTWDGTHSNVFQVTPTGCPEFDYHFWKAVAQSGDPNAHYYVWDSGSSFRKDGVGPSQDFRTITDQQTGVFFFDTTDGLAPHDDDADGLYDNLTPLIQISGGTWGVRGVVYLNSQTFRTTGISGRDVVFQAPGEPYQDKNANGSWDFNEDWINLDYPTTLAGKFYADSSDSLQNDGSTGGTPVRNSRGPAFTDQALVWGILYNNGFFDATGNGVYYGTVISKQGVGEYSPSAGTPNLYWDESLRDNWPPDGWGLPRVAITRWETDI